MDKKSFIKLLTPPIFIQLARFFLPKRRNIIRESPLPQNKHILDKIVVIGNGPSLRKSVELYKNDIVKYDRICVNYFGSTDLFEELKPNIYVFADPAFFWIPENQKESMTLLFDNIVAKTTWPLQIIIPMRFKGAPMTERILVNPNIRINYYYDGIQDVGKLSKFEAWDRNLVGPPAQTVLNVCVYLSLFWEYRQVYIIGADTTSLEDLRVDQETNELLSVDNHFYCNKDAIKNTAILNRHGLRKLEGWKLHEYIYAIGRMIEGYDELAEYAKYKGAKVYNASEYSWINCFERKKIG